MRTRTPCTYVTNPLQAWPSALAALSGANVDDRAVSGAETTVSTPSGIPPIIDQIKSVADRSTDIVVYEGGTNDLLQGSTDGGRVDAIAAAIHSRFPLARDVFVGVRYFWGSSPSQVDAWDAREQEAVTRLGGAFVDTRVWGADDYLDFPDGRHPSYAGTVKLAAAVAAAIERLEGCSADKTSS